MSEQEQKVEKTESEQIQLKVQMDGMDHHTVTFKIKKHTALKKLMQAYCDKVGVNRATVRFLFDGKHINDDDTPAGLELEDEDTLDVCNQQTGGNSL